MRPVFLDTVGLVAVWNERDQWHASASGVFARLLHEKTVLVTTPYLLAECANAVARRHSRAALVALREMLERRKRVLVPADEDWQAAWRSYATDRSGGPSVVDQLSFLAMRRYGSRELSPTTRMSAPPVSSRCFEGDPLTDSPAAFGAS